ncbi:TetR/AcrR family transcriptional regulator [Streptomyces sp. SID10815]|uniref:TetR/AcrR family transcriptional regulator n=1 Tax=Streptomyces sp. SID10815 TaxID=2706027 RepID=UPI0013CA9F50|nr:TetR/AcrR family transcriptional regulator [Streptomyces sp. SID10815]NEA49373.1 TetR/AcrR family transcriptional regulator [Streptomyces sp. SID10815]
MTNRPPAEPSLRERKKRETRQRISDVASGLFQRRGFDQVTVAEVARAADVSTMTVFNYFPRKEDLFLDRIPEAVETFTAAVRGRAPGERPLAALLRLGLDLLERRHPLSGVGENFGHFCQVVLDSPALRARGREGLEELEAALAGALAATAPEEPDPRLTAALAVAAYRTVCAASVRRLMAGEPVDEVAEGHRLRLTAAFETLDRALPPPAP